jgi:O-glycosyl hydrolase
MEARTANVSVGASGVSVELPADSITTLSWS